MSKTQRSRRFGVRHTDRPARCSNERARCLCTRASGSTHRTQQRQPHTTSVTSRRTPKDAGVNFFFVVVSLQLFFPLFFFSKNRSKPTTTRPQGEEKGGKERTNSSPADYVHLTQEMTRTHNSQNEHSWTLSSVLGQT